MGPLQQMGLWLRWLSLWLCEAVAIILILSFSVSSLCLPPKIKRFDSSRWGGGSDGHLYDFAKRQSGSLSKKFDPSRWLLVLVLLFFSNFKTLLLFLLLLSEKSDPSRWDTGSDGYLQDFAPNKRFDSSRWGGGSDGHLYDFAKK